MVAAEAEAAKDLADAAADPSKAAAERADSAPCEEGSLLRSDLECRG